MFEHLRAGTRRGQQKKNYFTDQTENRHGPSLGQRAKSYGHRWKN
jgi:hypothetical protein